jgi:hypothetical protein
MVATIKVSIFNVVCFFDKKANPFKALHLLMKRSLDPGCIMESSGEPVSKYRVMVYVPGRLEYILFSGAPTCLGHRSIFFNQYL